MSESFRPESLEQLEQAVAWAAAEDEPLEILGAGTKRGLGRPVQASRGLNLGALSGIELYEPEELILQAGAGTPVAEAEAALAESKQAFAFEPPDLGPLLGGEAGAGTLGGMVACNLAGPRRVKAGAARDHVLGFVGVSGRGETFRSGGRVMKNVTGYDLSKLMTGSYGTLAALAQVTLKVLPSPEATRSLVVRGLDPEAARRFLSEALNSAHEVSGAAYLPAPLCASLGDTEASATLARVEGPEPSADYRAKALDGMAQAFGPTSILETEASLALWREIRDVAPFQGSEPLTVWRVSVPPSAGPGIVERLDLEPERYFLDWGGGLIWLLLTEDDEARMEALRGEAAATGGHATLVRAPDELRARIAPFQPEPEALAALTLRVKLGFDPKRILNPGRMFAGV